MGVCRENICRLYHVHMIHASSISLSKLCCCIFSPNFSSRQGQIFCKPKPKPNVHLRRCQNILSSFLHPTRIRIFPDALFITPTFIQKGRVHQSRVCGVKDSAEQTRQSRVKPHRFDILTCTALWSLLIFICLTAEVNLGHNPTENIHSSAHSHRV